MVFLRKYAVFIVIAAALLGQVAITGCAARAGYGYRTYDPYYRDYHVWGAPEGRYYDRWIIETRRPHREYRRLRREEQRDYWRWRHNHNR